ncbi:MAG: nitroreductase [Gammaproteobacteria bacterium GWE2_42_36]|nr:MAG: nitroreductase [Gammaproteobacteria bacterium GWE2_42_36]HCU04766.1 nitroreductase [Coxiellaceae bacterium]
MLKDLALKNRSYRRFDENEFVDLILLKELVELARLCPSANNRQPLKYILSNTIEMNEKIFPTIVWAELLRGQATPKIGERPSAYIIILGDNAIKKEVRWDDGIVAQTMMLGAVEKGLGGCIIGAINKNLLREKLDISPQYEILLILALGKPNETILLETIKNQEYHYWRDENNIHHVPKRALDEIIL